MRERNVGAEMDQTGRDRPHDIRGLVSIIIPAFNSERHVRESLDSALGQTHRPTEIIVVDDGSTDRTVETVLDWIGSHAIPKGVHAKILRCSHGGPGAARNAGLAEARGEWVQFLDSDDILDPDKIALQVNALAESRDALAYCSWMYFGSGSEGAGREIVGPSARLPSHADPLREYIEGWFIPLHGFLWPRSLLTLMRGFDVNLRTDEDGELAIRALISGTRLVYVEGAEVRYRLHSAGQLSRLESKAKLRSRLRVVRKVAKELAARGKLDEYRESLAIRCDDLERTACLTYPSLAKLCRCTAVELAPGHQRRVRGGVAYRVGRVLLGLRASEWLSRKKRSAVGRG